MVSIREVRASNDSFKSSPKSTNLTAVFVGATSGIGYSTLRQLAIHVSSPKIYIVGRSLSRFTPQLEELKSLNPRATFEFIEAEVSLLKDVERVCEQLKSTETKLDLLFLSTGFLSLAGQQETPEGLPAHLTVTYYSRLLFTYSLIPLLQKSASPRVVTVLAGGQEAKIATDDLSLSQPSNYSFGASANHSGTMTTLAFDVLAASNPSISFIHIFPGLVKTDLLKGLLGSGKGFLGTLAWVVGFVVLPIVRAFSTSLDEAGEREMFVATSERFAVGEAKGGFWRLDWDAEEATTVPILETYRKEGMSQKVWDHTLKMFQKALGATN